MKALYVIVHAETVKDEQKKRPRAQRVMEKIQSIPDDHIIHAPDNPWEVIGIMPNGSKERRILVGRAYAGFNGSTLWCVDEACQALKNDGYDARVQTKIALPAYNNKDGNDIKRK